VTSGVVSGVPVITAVGDPTDDVVGSGVGVSSSPPLQAATSAVTLRASNSKKADFFISNYLRFMSWDLIRR
jgi:hypothetical protein